MYLKKRLELIIEKPAYRRASKVLEEAGVKTYNAFSAYGGYSNGVRWQKGTDLSASRDMIMIICVMDSSIAERVMENLESLIGTHIGLLSLSDVSVFRDDMF